ncbi:MAG: hypothetical protein E7376_00900 [Clostridiales bacterium]|nr:hypothetical protein [Clostridiales bacterium]
MKKKFLTFILCISFIIPAMFCLSACTQTPPDIQFKVEDGYVQYYNGESWSNLIAVADLEGEDGDDADVWTIGNDGYWYKNGVKQNHKAVGDVEEKGNGIKSITPSTDSTKTNSTQTTYIITLDDNSTYEFVVRNGTNGNNADVWTIGADGYWYKNGVKTNNKAIGEDGKDGYEYTIGVDGYWYLNDEKTQYKAIGTDADVWTIGTDGYWYKNAVKTEYKAVGENGKDATCVTYTVFFEYGGLKDCFNDYAVGITVKSTEWITKLPTIKEEFKESFIGWFISDTDKEIEKYDFIGGNVTLEARFNVDQNAPAGLYQNGECVKSWAVIKKEYPGAFDGTTIVSGYSGGIISFFRNESGDLVIDPEITDIGKDAFICCYDLTSIIIPNSVQSIGASAFYLCNSLTAIKIPSSVKSIGNVGLASCEYLTSISVDAKNSVYDSRNNCNAIIETKTNRLVAGCKNTIIPNDVISIGEFSFQSCSLTKIEIPNSVSSIGNGAFNWCDDLKNIEIPNSVVEIGYGAFGNCKSLKNVQLSTNLDIIDQGVFEGCLVLEEIKIPDNVIKIEYRSFFNCKSLKSIHISNNIIDIGQSAFEYAGLLNEVIIDSATIADGLTSNDSFGRLIYYATTIYIKTGLNTTDSIYLASDYTKQTASDKEGYDLWLKK